MNNRKWTNIILGYSIIYTITTLLNSVLYLVNGIYEDPSGNWHELDRAIIILIGVIAFELCTKLSVRPLILRYVIAYVPSQLLVFVYVWFCGFKEELAKTAYRDIWINFTSLLHCYVLSALLLVFIKRKRVKRFKYK